MPAIAGFEIRAEKLDNVFKLSQNRDEPSYLNIMARLREQGGNSALIAAEMEKKNTTLSSELLNGMLLASTPDSARNVFVILSPVDAANMNRLHRYTLIVLTCQLLFAGLPGRVSCADTYLRHLYRLPAFGSGIRSSSVFTAGNFSQTPGYGPAAFSTRHLRSTRSHITWVLLNYISGQKQYLFPGQDWQIVVPATNNLLSFFRHYSPKAGILLFQMPVLEPDDQSGWCFNNRTFTPAISQVPYTGGDFYPPFSPPDLLQPCQSSYSIAAPFFNSSRYFLPNFCLRQLRFQTWRSKLIRNA